VKLNLFVHAKPVESWDEGDHIVDGHALSAFRFDDLTSSGYFLVCPVTVEFEIPPEWDPRTQQLDSLKVQRVKLQKQFAEAVMNIDRQINSLLAIENTVEA
jgi:hypothetical protein